MFGANVKVFSGSMANDEIKLLIRMNHTALTPGEEAVVDYIGTLDTV